MILHARCEYCEHGRIYCCARGPDSFTPTVAEFGLVLLCNRAVGHAGEHVACARPEHAVARWL